MDWSGKVTHRFLVQLIAMILMLIGAGVLAAGCKTGTADNQAMRVAVPPFIDTAFTVVGHSQQVFKRRALDVELVSTTWEDQYEQIGGEALDVAMSTVDEFVNKERNLAAIGRQVLFILPAWQFKGLGFFSSTEITSLSELERTKPQSEAQQIFLSQIRDKKIVIPEGSVWEGAFRAFVSSAGLSVSDFKIVNARSDAALNSLSDKEVGLVAVGSQQRFEAERRGYREAISPERLGLDVITGFIVRKNFWEKRRPEVIKFLCAWYDIANFVTVNPQKTFSITNDYLVGRGANSLNQEEYSALRSYNVLPLSPKASHTLFFHSSAPASWREAWFRAVESMRVNGKGDQVPVNDNGFIAEVLNEELTTSCQGT